MVACSITNKEIKPNMVANFTAKLKTPRKIGYNFFVFNLIDEFGRKFGDELYLTVKVIDVPILNLDEAQPEQEESAFAEPVHESYVKYPEAMKQLEEMGLEITETFKDLVVKCRGRIEEVFENM